MSFLRKSFSHRLSEFNDEMDTTDDFSSKSEVFPPKYKKTGRPRRKSVNNKDRYIPNRLSQTFEKGSFGNENEMYRSSIYKKSMNIDYNSQILHLSRKPPKARFFDNTNKVIFSHSKKESVNKVLKNFRHVPQVPIRVLDAPELIDDYYLNLLDWGQLNLLAIGLRESVYLWDSVEGGITQLLACKFPDLVSCVNFSNCGKYLAVGLSWGITQIWDINREKVIRTLDGHSGRVGACSWNEWILSTGGSDTNIVNHDVRIPKHKTSIFSYHVQQICGLKWKQNGKLLASGSNDNNVVIWQQGHHKPKTVFQYHNAAVKAIDWCPYKDDVIATGGGSSCRKIYLWNINNGAIINSVDTKSQVCSLLFSRTGERELISAHGYTDNQLTLWSTPSLYRLTELKGHTQRILNTVMSPCGTVVCSAAGDETLRFWKVFNPKKKNPIQQPVSSGREKNVTQYRSKSQRGVLSPIINNIGRRFSRSSIKMR